MLDPINLALRYLKFRPRTVFEIEQKLKTKKISETEISRVIRALKKNKLLDDKNFAKMWVHDRNLLRPTGAYRIKMELRKLGVAEEIIEKSLAGQDEEELARRMLESKSRLKNADWQKKAAFLQRRGFRTGVIFKVLK